MKTTRFAFLLVLPALLILSSAGAALAGDKEHSYQVTNTADYQYGCDIKMTFSSGNDVEFKEVKQNQSVTKESKKCLENLTGCCATYKWEGPGYPPYGLGAACNAISSLYDQHICSDATFEIQPTQPAGFSVFVRVQ